MEKLYFFTGFLPTIALTLAFGLDKNPVAAFAICAIEIVIMVAIEKVKDY